MAVRLRQATVVEVKSLEPGADLLVVELLSSDDVQAAPAIAYTDLVGHAAAGDRVLLNTTAVELKLGTGGYHFVTAILPPGGETGIAAPLPGHLMKLRYTPMQCAVAAAEDSQSPYKQAAEGDEDLDATPVVACELHSQIAAAAAGFIEQRPNGKVVYVMTDGAALAASFSRLVGRLRSAGLLHAVITSGQCFGGDLEAINVYSALLLAKHALHADVIVVCQGPGNAGTASRFGFSGIAQGDAANAAASLGGRPIVCLRSSRADPRKRHQSPSHHTLTVLDRVVRCRCAVPIARELPGARRRLILDALRELRIQERHDVQQDVRGEPGVTLLENRSVAVTTMGRTTREDREYFQNASAAGAAAAIMVEMRLESVRV